MRNILVTGASSGLGAALALRLAAPGVRLGLVARDAARLKAVAAQARAAGAQVETGLADTRDRDAIGAVVAAFDTGGAIDMLVANAGAFGGREEGERVESVDLSLTMIDVNLVGALNTLRPALGPMRARRSGKIVLISSLAGLAPLPGALGYAAAKAGLVSYGLGLRHAVWDEGLRVSVVCPGVIATRPGGPRRPFSLTPEAAAAKILRGVEKERALIAFPFALALPARLAPLLPDALRRLAGRLLP